MNKKRPWESPWRRKPTAEEWAETAQMMREYLARQPHAPASAEAREKAVPPEQLLITLKNVWQSLAEVENARDFNQQQRTLQRLVTICIKEYFAD